MAKVFFLLLSLFLTSQNVQAAVVPDYATNNYQNHELSRAEKKCLEEGYKITYANCSNQTAPADRCPHHDAYYRSCSQEQWCRNNNYNFLAEDCKLPLFPVKMCANKYPLYRICQENQVKACSELGFVSKDTCKLSDKRCPYSQDYGQCCGKCEGFAFPLDQIPAGYIADGETCTTCDDIVMTNVKPASCEGYQDCQFGPLSPQTPSCLQGRRTLYSACKSAETLCKETGYNQTACAETEDTLDCPHHSTFKKCVTNCLKLAKNISPDADVFAGNETNPILDLTKTKLRSLNGLSHPDCQNNPRPVIELTINSQNMEHYQNILDRDIENITLKLNFEEPLSLPANGNFKNVKIIAAGSLAECPLQSEKISVSGTVSFSGIPTLCSNFDVAAESKLLTEGNIRGNVDLGKDAALGVKGSILGYLKSGNNSEIFVKGDIRYNDPSNNHPEDASILFGCNNKVKIGGGIYADTSAVIIRPWTKIDVAKIELKSISNNLKLPNTLGSLHLHKYTKLFSTYGSGDSQVVFPLVENDATNGCEDKYYIHLGSSVDAQEQTTTLEPTNLLEGKWTCRTLPYNQQQCN